MSDSLNQPTPSPAPGGSAPHDLLRRILDNIGDAFFALDEEWRFVYANQRALDLMTVDDEVLGRSVYEIFPAQVAGSKFADVYRHAMETSTPVRFESYFEPAGIWLEVNAQPYEGGLAIQLSDISERHEAELRLERSESLLRAILEQSDAGVSVGRPDGHVVYYNPAMERISGYSMEEVNAHGWFDLVFPEPGERNRAIEQAQQALRGELSYAETEIVRKDGERRWVSFSLAPVTIGGDVFNLGLTVDISERKSFDIERESLLAELAAIDRITDVALSTLDPGHLLERVLSGLLRVMDADVALVNAQGKNRILVRDERRGVVVDPESSIVNIVSFVEKPLRYGDEVHGTVQIGWAKPRPSQSADERLLGLAADRIASALTNAQLHDRASESARLGQTLASINAILHGSLEFEQVIDQVLEEAVKALQCDASTVLLREGEELVALHSAGFDDVEGGRSFTFEELPILAAFENPTDPVVTEDSINDPLANSAVAREFGIRSSLVAPLGLRGEIFGLVGFFYRENPGRFSPSMVQFASSLANSLSLAFENARLYQTEHDIAEALQGALIAMPERVRALRTAHVYQSASATTGMVGGDFYDAFELEGGRVALVIGDVSGKGLGAATLTSLIKDALRAHTVDDDPPAVAVAKTNRLTSLQTDPAMFATGILVVLNVRTGELTYCNAGHPPIFVLHPDKTCEVLTANSPLIGAFEDFEFTESTFQLQDGDVLMLVTDGVTEARRAGEQYGIDRLQEQVCSGPHDPDELVEDLRRSVSEFANGVLTDDIAIIAMRYNASDSPAGS